MKTRTLVEISDKVDDIMHSYGYVLDRHELSLAIFDIIRKQYPEEKLKTNTNYFKFTNRGQVFI